MQTAEVGAELDPTRNSDSPPTPFQEQEQQQGQKQQQQHAGAWPQSDPSGMRTSHMSDPPLGASVLLHHNNSNRAQDGHGVLNGHNGMAAGMGMDTSSGLLMPRAGSTSPPPIHGGATGLAGPYSSAFRRYNEQDASEQATLPQQQAPAQPALQGTLPLAPGPPTAPTAAATIVSNNAARARGTAVVNKATTGLVATYNASSQEANPAVPRRALTKPSEGVKNDGYDNENSDLVMRVGDVLLNHNPTHGITRKYTIQHMLGQGTFGQVASCWSDEMQRNVAVKVIKNQPAYFHQARVEIGLLNLLNTRCDPHDERHIVRMLDSFLFRKHLCIVFEKLDVNLFELLKRNAFKGLSLPTVQSLLRQLLDSLMVLRDSSIMHCDLKPENILLKTMGSDEIKLIDFGSACFENRVVYSYIQSRFYRSPEVVLGTSYNVAIDMWSLGCVAAELFLGLPLFPGASEHDLMVRIVETLGTPPAWLMAEAKHTERYFKRVTMLASGSQQLPLASPSLLASSLNSGGLGPYDLASSVPRYQHQHLAQLAAQQQRQAGMPGAQNTTSWVLLSQPEFESRNACKAPVGKRYFMHTQLADIIAAYPMRPGLQDDELNVERVAREAFIDFLLGVLDLDPRTRWTPRQAAAHPFITGAPFTGPFQPSPDSKPPMRPIHPGGSSSTQQTLTPQAPSSQPGGMASLGTAIPVATQQQQAQQQAASSGAFGMPVPMPGTAMPQGSLPGSFQTSFIMGTPHKRVAINRASPAPHVAQQQQQQQQQSQQGLGGGWGGGAGAGTSHAADPSAWGSAVSSAMGALATGGQGGSLQPDVLHGQAPMLTQADAAHAHATAAARALAFAALQQIPPQLLASGGLQGYGNIPIPGLHLQQQQGLGASGHLDMQTDMQQQQPGAMGSGATRGLGSQAGGTNGGGGGNLSGATSSSQALANIILGSTPSTPHLPPAAWGATWAMGLGSGGGGNGGHSGAAGNNAALGQLALQQQISQGLLSGMMSSAEMQNVANMAAMAAVRQAAVQQQQQQQAGMAMGLTPQQLVFLRQQQQAVAAAVAAGGAQFNSMGASGYGLGGGMNAGLAGGLGWGQQQPSQPQQTGLGSWPMQPLSAAAQAALAQLQQQQQQQQQQHAAGLSSAGQGIMLGSMPQPQHHHHSAGHMRRASYTTMVEDSDSPVMFANHGQGGGGNEQPGSSQGTVAVGPAGGASPSDWDPLGPDGDWMDTPGSPLPGSNGAIAKGRTSATAATGARMGGGRAASSRASSGHDGAVASAGVRSGLVVSSTAMSGRHGGQQQPQQLQSSGGDMTGMHASNAIAAMIAQQQQQQAQLVMHGQLPLMGGSGYMGSASHMGTGMLLPHNPGAQAMDTHADQQAAGGWLQQQQQSSHAAPALFGSGGMMGGSGSMGGGGSMTDPSQVVGSLPFSGMGAAPAMHMYQLMLAQQRQQQAAQAAGAQSSDMGGYTPTDHTGHG